MLILREVAASTEDSSSALGANGGTRHERQQTRVVNPEAVQCRNREIRTDKSASRHQIAELTLSSFSASNPLGSPNQNRFERRSALMVRTASDHTRTAG
jgi:hypothetical protein